MFRATHRAVLLTRSLGHGGVSGLFLATHRAVLLTPPPCPQRGERVRLFLAIRTHRAVLLTQPPYPQRGERVRLFRAALQQQTDIMVENILGEGIDLHLLGLQEMAADLGMKEPELFRHETYKIANHFGLSTSQVRDVR